MRDIILVKLNEELEGQASWLRLGDSIQEPVIEFGPLEEVANAIGGARIIGLVPSSAVLLTFARVPVSNKQRILKAIPYALEEDLASDVDNLHFAIGDPTDDGKVPVAVVDRELMTAWLDQFRNAGLSIDLLIPDVFITPHSPDQWSLVLDGKTAVMRTGDQTGAAFDSDNLNFILSLFLKKNAEELPESIEFWADESVAETTPLETNDVELHTHNNRQGLLGLVSKENLDTSKAINLLQGAFSRREQVGKYLRPWRVAAGLVAVWFVMALTSAIIESNRLEAEYEKLKAEAETIYKQAFPEAKRVVKPKAQMQQKLAELRSGGGETEGSFLTLMADAGQVFRTTAGLVLRSVRYKSGVLDVDLELPNLQTLDQLKQSLAGTKNLQVEIQSAASRNNKVQGRLQITQSNQS